MNSPRNNDPQILEPVTMPTNLGRIRPQTRAKICHDFRGDICLGMKELMSQYDEPKRLLDSASGERTVVNWLKESRENTLVLSRTVSQASAFTIRPFGCNFTTTL